jgi:hypothetical protein
MIVAAGQTALARCVTHRHGAFRAFADPAPAQPLQDGCTVLRCRNSTRKPAGIPGGPPLQPAGAGSRQ